MQQVRDAGTGPSCAGPAFLALKDVRVAYGTPQGQVDVIRGFSMALARGQVGCLLGPSGCGKSTILRTIAGFEPVRDGVLALDGRILSSAGCHVAPERRRVGMMFQDYALFPHMTIGENVGFGVRGVSRRERAARVQEMLALVRLGDLSHRYPHQLSGGQQQRVALARALASGPEILLLDEPFSNLDADTRGHLAREVRDIIKAANQTAVVVTHNREEAIALADRIGVMHEGCLVRWTHPDASCPGQCEPARIDEKLIIP